MGRFVSGDRAGRIGVGEVVACCAIVVVAAWFISPAFLRVRKQGGPPGCQSNLKQIGNAFKIYLGEWHDTYPTNRALLSNGKLGRVASHIKLMPADDRKWNRNGTLAPSRYGINWVEALFPYMEAISKDSSGAWACPLAKQKYPENSNTAAVSYAFNRNLAGRPEEAIRTSSNMLMVREMDRLVDAELRPTNYSCGLPGVPPDSAFLTKHDSRIGRTNPKQHSNGSNILFADGHVKSFNATDMPDKPVWDPKDRQWYNCIDPSRRGMSKSIGITP